MELSRDLNADEIPYFPRHLDSSIPVLQEQLDVPECGVIVARYRWATKKVVAKCFAVLCSAYFMAEGVSVLRGLTGETPMRGITDG